MKKQKTTHNTLFRRIIYLIILILLIFYYLTYQVKNENPIRRIAVQLFGEEVAKNLYRLPFDELVIRFDNGECYNPYFQVYPLQVEAEIYYSDLSTLIDIPTFKFTGEEKNGMIVVFEDKRYKYEFFFEEEIRYCAAEK